MSTEIVKAAQSLTFENQQPVLRNSDDVKTLASLLINAGWTKHSPAAACVAIMHGKSLGLNPWQSVQSIAVINGRPTLWGDGLVAVVQRSGECEGIEANVAGEGEKMVATVTVHRKNHKAPYTQRFSMADAKRAGLLGKAGPWTNYPQRMLVQRARSWALRDAFPDVLNGIIDRDEAEDYGPPAAPRAATGFADTQATPLPEAPQGDIDDLPDAPLTSTEDAAEFAKIAGGGK
jgi:hypothetical protein